ncbi:hypothetical protein FHS96_004940 [Sphingomonas zeicaulis]|uniref:hypothetical protein n=1 Tax=Sphingomonas zeicaulis TaxID=1632740 RepID=UPI003D25B00E
MANESAAGRDGFILAAGRKIYHVYKQSFPMEFWYGLTPDANREFHDRLIDVRSLPERYRRDSHPLEVHWTAIPKRSLAKAGREQLVAHAMTFAAAIVDGYDLDAHIDRERAAAEQEAAQRRQEKARQEAAWLAAGLCCCCGQVECDIPF